MKKSKEITAEQIAEIDGLLLDAMATADKLAKDPEASPKNRVANARIVIMIKTCLTVLHRMPECNTDLSALILRLCRERIQQVIEGALDWRGFLDELKQAVYQQFGDVVNDIDWEQILQDLMNVIS